MKNEKLLNELNILRKDAESIIKRIDALEKELRENNDSSSIDSSLDINPDSSLKEKFIEYLYKVAKVQEFSVNAYLRDLKRIRKLFKQYLNIDLPCEVIEIGDLDLLKKLTSDLYENIDFQQYNKKNHYHYSAPLNNYLEFLAYNNNSFEFED